ncbi:MAG TPA: RNA ligase family protein [Thermomicrobiales bacterium]|jgi:hypothetical protein
MSLTCATGATPPLRKYPRTQHLTGSAFQTGDDDLASVPIRTLAGRRVVIEEKIDGANAAISFDAAGQLHLQSRGHYLTGGPRERHFAQLKAWASAHLARLYATIGDRYIVYGEWLYAKHTVFYDALPHFFLEFDVLDTMTGAFLDTASRRALLADTPLVPVPVLHDGPAPDEAGLRALIGPSAFKTARWRDALDAQAIAAGVSPAVARAQTDPSELMEGLYLKVEEGGRVVERLKFVRRDFLTTIADAGEHWRERPIIANVLRPGIDLYADASEGSR